jgi:hypothetical protein
LVWWHKYKFDKNPPNPLKKCGFFIAMNFNLHEILGSKAAGIVMDDDFLHATALQIMLESYYSGSDPREIRTALRDRATRNFNTLSAIAQKKEPDFQAAEDQLSAIVLARTTEFRVAAVKHLHYPERGLGLTIERSVKRLLESPDSARDFIEVTLPIAQEVAGSICRKPDKYRRVDAISLAYKDTRNWTQEEARASIPTVVDSLFEKLRK